MKKSAVIIIGTLLFLVFGIQVFMFYRIHEKLDQRYSLEKNLNLSSQQGSDTWIQDDENWNPYQELFQMRNKMEQMFHDSESRFHKKSTAGSFTQIPAIDLKNEKDRYVVTADVPGADESSLDVVLDGRQLTITIKTESVREQAGDSGKYLRRERLSGEFQRSLTLPGDVDKAGMKTEYNNGVVTITIPKA
jgi:HSP20 family protein